MRKGVRSDAMEKQRKSVSLFQKWREQQMDKEAYMEHRDDIARYNLGSLKQMGWIGMVVGFILVLACLPPLRLLTMLPGYLSLALLFTALVALTNTVLKKHTAMVLPVFYFFILLLLGLSIVMGTVWGKDANATTFVMLIVVLPLFIIDRPWRLNLIFGLMCLIFCVIDYNTKDGVLLSLDLANCAVFYLLSVLISRQTIAVRLSDIIIQKELKRQRDMDMLTKLDNRGSFERRVEQYMRESNQDAIMLLMDLDNFKSVNDLMGHEYGDLVLKVVGEYMQSAFRQGDIVSRLGGDEFIAFLPAVGEISVITDKVEALITQIKSIEEALHLSCAISASVGIARYPQDGRSFQELYRCADAALYSVKRSNKGTFAVFDGMQA